MLDAAAEEGFVLDQVSLIPRPSSLRYDARQTRSTERLKWTLESGAGWRW